MKKIELLNEMIGLTDDPFLLNDVELVLTGKEVVLDSSTPIEELCENKNMPPTWYNKLSEVSGRKILIIDNINSISEEEQAKFIDIIKHKKVGIYDLPKDTLILIVCSSKFNNKVNETILSLVTHI